MARKRLDRLLDKQLNAMNLDQKEQLVEYLRVAEKSPGLGFALAALASILSPGTLRALRGASEGVRTQALPWSNIPPSVFRQLLDGNLDENVTRVVEGLRPSADLATGQAEATRRLLRAMGSWMRGKRRLIRVSAQAQDLLSDVARQRLIAGMNACRWGDLPAPGSDLYGQGIMFLWERQEAITYAAPYGLFLEEHVLYTHWSRVAVQEGEESFGQYDSVWATHQGIPEKLSAEWYQREIEDTLEYIQEQGEAFAKEAADAVRCLRLIHWTVNALAALNNEFEIEVWRGEPRKRNGKSKSTGGIGKVSSIRLDESGLAVWAKRYVRLPDTQKKADYDASSGSASYHLSGSRHRGEGGDRAAPCLHRRDDHTSIVYVSQPKPGEQILGARDYGKRADGSLRRRYAVRRPRKGGPAGGRVKATAQRMKVGIDGLDT